MTLRKNRALPSGRRRLLRPLACVLGAALLAASSVRASVTIGYDPMVDGDAGKDLSFSGGPVFYVPFAFDVGGPYSLDSVRLLLLNPGSLSGFSILVTSTLGTDSTVPAALTTLSATGTMAGPSTVYTFNADSLAVLTSGSTYYLRMTYDQGGDPQWVSLLSLSGAPPADSGDPDTKDGPGDSGGGPGGHGGSPPVTLTSLTTLNPSGFTFRYVSGDTYTDKAEPYGISITATAVPEPAAFAMVVGGLTLGTVLLRRLRRRR